MAFRKNITISEFLQLDDDEKKYLCDYLGIELLVKDRSIFRKIKSRPRRRLHKKYPKTIL